MSMLFIENYCKWPSCGKNFQTMEDLIEHMEVCHVVKENTPVFQDFEKSPTVHLSHISRYFSEEQLQQRRREKLGYTDEYGENGDHNNHNDNA
eukprot:Pgem_evm1s15439